MVKSWYLFTIWKSLFVYIFLCFYLILFNDFDLNFFYSFMVSIGICETDCNSVFFYFVISPYGFLNHDSFDLEFWFDLKWSISDILSSLLSYCICFYNVRDSAFVDYRFILWNSLIFLSIICCRFFTFLAYGFIEGYTWFESIEVRKSIFLSVFYPPFFSMLMLMLCFVFWFWSSPSLAGGWNSSFSFPSFLTTFSTFSIFREVLKFLLF